MATVKPAIHGRDHRPGGADPIPGFGASAIYKLVSAIPTVNQGSTGPSGPFLGWTPVAETPGVIELDDITPSIDIVLIKAPGRYTATLQMVAGTFDPLDFGNTSAVLEGHVFLSDGVGGFPFEVVSHVYADQALVTVDSKVGLSVTLPFVIDDDVGDMPVPGMLGTLFYNYDNLYTNMVNEVKTDTRFYVERLGDV
jgi:hypothetical protein